jgi:succinate dehydrogenase hydrophobic anchor subunit
MKQSDKEIWKDYERGNKWVMWFLALFILVMLGGSIASFIYLLMNT